MAPFTGHIRTSREKKESLPEQDGLTAPTDGREYVEYFEEPA